MIVILVFGAEKILSSRKVCCKHFIYSALNFVDVTFPSGPSSGKVRSLEQNGYTQISIPMTSMIARFTFI